MEHIYEYLIGGKKTGKQKQTSFNDLQVGDTIYVYYMCKTAMENTEEIWYVEITGIKRGNAIYEFNYKNEEYHIDIRVKDLNDSFYISSNLKSFKFYFATSEKELFEHLDNVNLPKWNK